MFKLNWIKTLIDGYVTKKDKSETSCSLDNKYSLGPPFNKYKYNLLAYLWPELVHIEFNLLMLDGHRPDSFTYKNKLQNIICMPSYSIQSVQ